MNNLVKIVLSILFLVCLLEMPYGYYQLVRFAGLVGFALLAYNAYEQGDRNTLIIYCSLALLFQPFFKIALGRTIWNVVDVLVAVGLLLSLFLKPKDKSST